IQAENVCGNKKEDNFGLLLLEELKACPDCRWVFYDHSRNGSKRWCGMYAGEEGGRACGTIAKVKNYRAKRKGRSGYDM
ncbi:CGNR zinc finger domain-containing protein, partial [Bacillus sp. HC-TM]